MAVTIGTVDAMRQLYGTDQPRADALGWINAHALVGVAILVIYWQALQIRRRNSQVLSDPHKRRGYLARLAIGVGLLLLDGWLGGHLVYTLRLGVAS